MSGKISCNYCGDKHERAEEVRRCMHLDLIVDTFGQVSALGPVDDQVQLDRIRVHRAKEARRRRSGLIGRGRPARRPAPAPARPIVAPAPEPARRHAPAPVERTRDAS